MSGCDPLDKATIKRVALHLAKGRNGLRDRALFVLGVSTGLRVSELLALTIGDVIGRKAVLNSFYLKRCHTKGKTLGRKVELIPIAKKAIAAHVADLLRRGKGHASFPLFMAQGSHAPMSRKSVWRVQAEAFNLSGFIGKTGTHSMRKTFACNLYDKEMEAQLRGKKVEPLRVVQHALGHRDMGTTEKYISSLVYDPRSSAEEFTNDLFDFMLNESDAL